MKKLILAIVFFLFSLTLALGGLFLGERLTTQKYKKAETLLSDKGIRAFCTNVTSAGCLALGLQGTVSGYDYAAKKIDFLVSGDHHFDVLLSNDVRVDDEGNIAYFEKIIRRGDVIWVIFDVAKFKGSSLPAIDIYIDKTGVLAKKKNSR